MPSPERSSPGAAFLLGPAPEVAPRLLGWVLRTSEVAVRLSEVEAYGGEEDPGSHAWRGQTRRNASMFGPAGDLYCYLSYGIHVCANVVVGPPGRGGAVLLRAGEVVQGEAQARTRRGDVAFRDLARGPGNLTRALGIDLAHDGCHLLEAGASRHEQGPEPTPGAPPPRQPARQAPQQPRDGRGRVWLERGAPAQAPPCGPRVGLTAAPDRAWRWWCAEDRTVSAYRRSPRAGAP